MAAVQAAKERVDSAERVLAASKKKVERAKNELAFQKQEQTLIAQRIDAIEMLAMLEGMAEKKQQSLVKSGVPATDLVSPAAISTANVKLTVAMEEAQKRLDRTQKTLDTISAAGKALVPPQRENDTSAERGPETEKEWVTMCNALIDGDTIPISACLLQISSFLLPGSLSWPEFKEHVQQAKEHQIDPAASKFRRNSRRFGGEVSASGMDQMRTSILKTTMASRQRGMTEMPAFLDGGFFENDIFENEAQTEGGGFIATVKGIFK